MKRYKEKETRGTRLIYVGNVIYVKLESNRGGRVRKKMF